MQKIEVLMTTQNHGAVIDSFFIDKIVEVSTKELSDVINNMYGDYDFISAHQDSMYVDDKGNNHAILLKTKNCIDGFVIMDEDPERQIGYMLQAMNTGHDGSLSTGHANSTEDMLSRLETMVLQGAAGLPLEAIRQQIASAVDIIIHLSRLRDKSRKTMEITEVVGYENGKIILNPLYVFEEDEHSTMEKVSGHLNRTTNKMQNTFKLRLYGFNDEI